MKSPTPEFIPWQRSVPRGTFWPCLQSGDCSTTTHGRVLLHQVFPNQQVPQTIPPSPVHAKDVRQSLRTDTRSVDHPHVSLDSRIALERWQVGTPNTVARLHLVGFIPHPVPDIAELLIFFVATLSLSQSGCHFYLVAKS